MTKIRDMKIGRKLTASYVVLILFFAVCLISSLVGIQSVARDMEVFYQNQFQVVQTSQTMKTDLQGYAKGLSRMAEATANLRGLGSEEAAEYLQKKTEQMQVFLGNIEGDINLLNSYDIGSTDEMKLINANYPVVVNLTEQLMEYFRNGQIEEGVELSSGALDENAYAIGVALETIIATAQQQAEDKYAGTQELARNLITMCMVLSVILTITAIVLSVKLTRAITGPLKEMEHAAGELAEGNLSQDIAYKSGDEVGSLAESLRQTIRNLTLYIKEIDRCLNSIGHGKLNYQSDVNFRGDFVSIKKAMDDIAHNLTEAMVQINASADQVMCGAEQIAGSGQALSQATLEQASSVEELGVTINSVSRHVQESAESAMATSRLTEDVGEQVVESSRQMQELTVIMDQMKEMSGKMSGIIKDIEDIAFQTNILSLNAAVEAARAGDAGRGFLVVANEIRRLSGKTTEASKSTSELIGQTVSMMVQGADMTSRTSGELMKVAEAAKDVAERVEIISKASNEQATAVIQLRESIEQISAIVQENSATAEESAASSEELTGQMQMLKKLVASFEYDNE